MTRPHMRLASVAFAALTLFPLSPMAAVTTIDFESLPAASTFFSGNVAEPASRLSNQLSGSGVVFSSGANAVAVVPLGLGHATSGINGIAALTPDGYITYNNAYPIEVRFVDTTNSSLPATANFVSVRADMGGSSYTLELRAYALDGSLIGTAVSPDSGGATLSINGPGIHRVVFAGTPAETFGGAGGAALDDLVFEIDSPGQALVTLDFEEYTAMGTFFSGVPVPESARLGSQLASLYGVVFASSAPYVAVVPLGVGHATSGTKGIGMVTPEGILTYNEAHPLEIRFVDPADVSRPATTDFVSIRADLAGSSQPLTARAYGIDSSLLATLTVPDIGGATLAISAPGIHRFVVTGTNAATFGGAGGAAFDDLRFTAPVPVGAENALSVTKAGNGTGVVASMPPGIDCGDVCSASFDDRATVVLTAIPGETSAFVGWNGSCTGTGTCTVTMDEARDVAATFSKIEHVLTVSKYGTGVGSVTSMPPGISNCSTTCLAMFPVGTSVVLNAVPGANSMFAGWEGACSGSGSCTINMDAAKSVMAAFISPTTAAHCKNDGWLVFGFRNQGQCMQFVNTGK